MGTPSAPNETANPCTICWGPGKVFGDVPTPKIIYVALTQLLPGELWVPSHEQLLLTTHLLEQRVAPCEWYIEDTIFKWSLNYNIQFSSFEVRRLVDNERVFVDNMPPPCNTDIENALDAPAGVIAYNGFANLYWNQEDLA